MSCDPYPTSDYSEEGGQLPVTRTDLRFVDVGPTGTAWFMLRRSKLGGVLLKRSCLKPKIPKITLCEKRVGPQDYLLLKNKAGSKTVPNVAQCILTVHYSVTIMNSCLIVSIMNHVHRSMTGFSKKKLFGHSSLL